MHLLYRSNNFSKAHRSPIVWACQWPSSQSLSSPQSSHNDSLWASGITKSHRDQRLDYRRLRKCLDAHLGQIVCDKDAVVDWCIVLLEMPLTGITSWTPLKPQHSNQNPNPNPLANQLRCIDFLTLAHLSSSITDSPWLPWISYAAQKLMLDSCKMLQKQSDASHTFLCHFFQV